MLHAPQTLIESDESMRGVYIDVTDLDIAANNITNSYNFPIPNLNLFLPTPKIHEINTNSH